jgi:hypothetical protein
MGHTWKFFESNPGEIFNGIDFPVNSRFLDAIRIATPVIWPYRIFEDIVRKFISKIFLFVPRLPEVETTISGNLFNTRFRMEIIPLIGLVNPTITLSSQRGNKIKLLLEHTSQLYFMHVKGGEFDENDVMDIDIDHGRHFKFDWLPGTYIIAALDRPDFSASVKDEFKSVTKMLRTKSPFLCHYLFINNIALLKLAE